LLLLLLLLHASDIQDIESSA